MPLARPVRLAAVTIADGAVEIGGRPVLRGIDLSVEVGEFVALMGANGSGKSTLVRALLGLRPLTAGEVRLFGTPLRRLRRLAADRLRAAARHRGFRRAGLGLGGRRLRPADPAQAAPPARPAPTAPRSTRRWRWSDSPTGAATP